MLKLWSIGKITENNGIKGGSWEPSLYAIFPIYYRGMGTVFCYFGLTFLFSEWPHIVIWIFIFLNSPVCVKMGKKGRFLLKITIFLVEFVLFLFFEKKNGKEKFCFLKSPYLQKNERKSPFLWQKTLIFIKNPSFLKKWRKLKRYAEIGHSGVENASQDSSRLLLLRFMRWKIDHTAWQELVLLLKLW